MIRFLALIFSVALLSCAVSQGSAAQKIVKVGVYDNKPMMFMGKERPEGLFIDVLEHVAEIEGWVLDYEYDSWETTFKKLKSGRIGILPVVAAIEPREPFLDFSQDTLITNYGQVYTGRDVDISAIQDLKGRKIALQPMDTHGEYFSSLLQKLNIETIRVEVADYLDIFKALDAGEVQAGVVNRVFATAHEREFAVQTTPIVFNPIQNRYAVPEGDPKEVLPALDHHLPYLLNNPGSIYHESMGRWFTDTPSGAFPPWSKKLLSVMIVLAVAALAIILWLRMKIRRKTGELKQSNARLQEREEHLNSILQATPDPLVVYDIDGHPQYINPAFTRVFGWTFHELQGRVIPFVPEGEKKETYARIEEIYRTGKPVKFETMRVTRDGRVLDIMISAAIIQDQGGRNKGLVVNQTDISNVKNLEAQFQQAQKMEAVARLAGGVAHDLNNLLTPILGYSDLLLTSLSPQGAEWAKVKSILFAGERARDLVRQLLAYSRKQTLEIAPIDVNRLIEDYELLLGKIIREDIELRVVLDPEVPAIQADKGQLEQVLLNLAVNAQDAMSENGRLSIQTSSVVLDESEVQSHQEIVPGHYAVLEVRDTGHGMDKETQEQIFDPFFTTKEQDKGTGLGLATVYGIVKQHQGSILIDSSPGQGTTFKIHLPVAGWRQEALQPSTPQEKSCPQGHETVLVVEDDDMVRELAVSVLENDGYKVVYAENGARCLEKIASMPESPDLMLTDVIMPNINGKVLYERVAEAYPQIKVVFMSGHPEDVISNHGVLEAGVDFIQKPFSVQDLCSRVRDVLDS